VNTWRFAIMIAYLLNSEVDMNQTLEATFDGQVFRPDQPIELEPNTRVRITIEAAKPSDQRAESFLRVARSLTLEGPRDWSSRLDEYLYGGRSLTNEQG
jgi:predicted DNA-binding antitoxin AbrB/MazE fold protein